MSRFLALCLAVVFAVPVVGQAPPVAVEPVAAGFSFGIGAASADDGSDRIFVVQQSGEIRIWDGTTVLATPFLDLSATVSFGGEQGLLGLAFHPDYEVNGFFFVNYTDGGGDTVVERYSVSAGDPDVADPLSGSPVLDFFQPATNHNGGDLQFGPDGFLYVASGDGGADWGNGQDVGTLLGKLLRIDVDTDDFPGDPDRNYGIPAGNPFVGVAGAAEEIYHLGLRNPWRFSFDRETGEIFVGDVGEGSWEEIDLAPAASAGTNWGWPCWEGSDPFDTSECDLGGFSFPILELPHGSPPNNNCSVIGGYRYRGSASPAHTGWYFFTDWCTGTLWAAEDDGGWTAHDVASLGGFSFTGFVEDEAGEIYVAGSNELLRIFDPTNGIFADGFESGDTDAWSSTTP